MKLKTLLTASALALAAMASQPFHSTPAQATDAQEYCISGTNSKLVKMRDKGSDASEEAGLARGGDCGMSIMQCQGDWCQMQMHDFNAWVKKADLRKK